MTDINKHIEKLINMLQNPKSSTRYEACEHLRVAPAITSEAIIALQNALNDPDASVAEAAQRALAVQLAPESSRGAPSQKMLPTSPPISGDVREIFEKKSTLLSNQEHWQTTIIRRSAFQGLLAGLLLSIIVLAIPLFFILSTPAIDIFAGPIVYIYGFLFIIFSTLIGGFSGFLISWLVIRFASQSISRARVIGALVAVTIAEILEALLVISSSRLNLSIPGIIVFLVYIAIGIWGAGRICRSLPSDDSGVKTSHRGYHIFLAITLTVMVISGGYIIYNLIPFTTNETHSMKFNLEPNSEPGARCETHISLVFVESPDVSVNICSPELFNYLKNETEAIVPVDFKATSMVMVWEYEIQRVGSWSGSVKIVSLSFRGIYCMGTEDPCPFLHNPINFK